MADLNALGLNDEGISDSDFENMPQTVGGASRIPPQPGIYRFKLPSENAIRKSFDILNTSDQGQKIVAIFVDEAALFNVTLSNWYNARLNNRTRLLKQKGGAEVVVSDMGMLLKALNLRPEANEQGVITNRAYGNALVAGAGKEFIAEHSLTAHCDKNRDIYKEGKVQSGEKGCGQKYAVTGYAGKLGKPDVLSIPKTDDAGNIVTTGGKVATRFVCKCGAELMTWSQLGGFRSAD